MSKHRKARRRRRYLRGTITDAFDLGTLGGATVAKEDLTETVSEVTWISSIRAAWTLVNYTAATDDGPILVGIAHSDYSAAEIEDYLETTNSWNQSDLVKQEVAKRKIRRVGVFDSPADALAVARLQEGKMITTKCGWLMSSGQTLSVWAYNLGGSALATTVPRVNVNGHANLWPR